MSYNAQFRGDNSAYASYYNGMDKSMRQKVALISSYFPSEGTVADMGSGSGSGSYDLACLYPGLHVVGVDISASAVNYSREKYVRENLSYKEGDIANKLFSDNELTGILNSSVLHHVTSFNNFDTWNIERLLDNQTEQLSPGGILAIRDFVIPDFGKGNEIIILELPENDGTRTGTPAELNTAALFEKFFREFQCSAYGKGQGKYIRLQDETAGTARFETDLRSATEFILRKDYRADWDVEILEEYLYYTKTQFETEFKKRGLRIVISREIRNPWIITNRFEGKVILKNKNGDILPYPPTNYLIVGEKSNGSVAFTFSDFQEQKKSDYLIQETFYDGSQVWDMVSRKNPTYDLVPYYFKDNRLHIVARQGYPRPLAALNESPDGASVSGYIHEPVIVSDIPEKDRLTKDDLISIFAQRTELSADSVKKCSFGMKYYPSPGGINEQVRAAYFQITNTKNFIFKSAYTQGFQSSGEIRSLDAAQFLRAGQVGGICDNRLEMNIYDLMFLNQLPPDPWIGADYEENEINQETFDKVIVMQAEKLVLQDSSITVSFRKIVKEHEFLKTESVLISETDKNGNILSGQRYDYVKPSKLSLRTISVLPYFSFGKKLFVGIELRRLPAPFISEGVSEIFTTAAFRLPVENAEAGKQEKFVIARIEKEFQLRIKNLLPLGGAYYPSPAVTPEAVAVYAAPTDNESLQKSGLTYIALDDLIENRYQLRDGHLLVAAFRLHHCYQSFLQGG
jgi:SAM-dependent methyltransferase